MLLTQQTPLSHGKAAAGMKSCLPCASQSETLRGTAWEAITHVAQLSNALVHFVVHRFVSAFSVSYAALVVYQLAPTHAQGTSFVLSFAEVLINLLPCHDACCMCTSHR